MSDNISNKTIYSINGNILTSDRPIYKLMGNPNALLEVVDAFQITAAHNIDVVSSRYKWYIGEDNFCGSRKLVIGKEIYTITLKCTSPNQIHIINGLEHQIISNRPIYKLMGNPNALRKVTAACKDTAEHNIDIAGYSWYISKSCKNKSSRQLVIGKEIYTITLICI